MKKNLFVLMLLLLGVAQVRAQEKVYPISVEERENEFYEEQFKLWRAVTQRDPKNAVAWQNLYHAARYRDFPRVLRDNDYRAEVEELLEEMRKAIPNTFESHYLIAWHYGLGPKQFDDLMAAYRLGPDRPRILEDLFTYHLKQGEWAKADEYLAKWYARKEMAPQLLHFCYNLLACTGQDGVLILVGDNDSFPTWMLQGVKGVRKDVASVNISLMQLEKYARKALQFFGLKADEAALQALWSGETAYWTRTAAFIRHLAAKNPDRPIYIPMTAHEDFYNALEGDLHVVGTVYQYCEKPLDNIALLKRNWYQNLKLDHLDFMVYEDDYRFSYERLPYTLVVYLYPAVTLYHHYQRAGEKQKAEEMLALAKDLSRKMGDPDRYKSYVESLGQ